MSEPIKNRYDLSSCSTSRTATPTATPTQAICPVSTPRPGYGLVTDVCLKRKIRNYVETLKEDETGYRIYIKDGVPLNRSDAEAITALDVAPDLKEAKKADPDIDGKCGTRCARTTSISAPSAPS